ncbi:MAG: DMT family transporter [Gemmobacter sp.]|nr:DMT family transporter [Gemmobacter sp.]
MTISSPRHVHSAPLHRPLAAALWMIGSIVFFSTIAVAGRELKGRHDTFEIMMWRSLIGVLLVAGFAVWTGRFREVSAHRLGTHAVRNTIHFTGQNLWLWALTMIPLAQLFAIEFTAPIWVVLLSPLLLGERLTRRRVFAAGLGFMGILIVARPDFSHVDPGVLAAAGAAVSFAVTILITKTLTRHESIVSIMFWLTLMQLILGLVAAGYDGEMRLPDAETLPWLVLIGVAGLAAHVSLTTALSLAPASFVMPIDFVRLPVAAVIGVVLYNEGLEVPVVVGAALILAANWINLRARGR